jgi:hypothetical protein
MSNKIEYTTTVYEDENSIVRVHKPILTDEEYAKREAVLKEALARFWVNTNL